MSCRVAHIGAFDFKNYGDLLFVDVFERQIENRLGEVDITLFSPKGGILPNCGKRIYPITDLEKKHLEAPFDAFVVGGGDLVHLQKIHTYVDGLGEAPVIYEVLYMWVIPSILSWKYEIPVLWNAPGVPLAFEDRQKPIVQALCALVDYISVRDCNAMGVLADAGVSRDLIKVVPDTVLSIASLYDNESIVKYFNAANLPISPREYVFFQCNTSFTREEVEACARFLHGLHEKTGWKVLLQPIGFGLDDQAALQRVFECFPEEFILSERPFNQFEIMSLIAEASCYIGSSLHGCITANAFGRPNVVINRNHYNKTDGLVKILNREYSQVFEVSDLEEALMEGMGETAITSLPDDVGSKIEKHFDDLADLIVKPPAKRPGEVSFPLKLAEYFYDMGELERNMMRREGELLSARSSCRELADRVGQLERELDGIRNSRSWRVTAPIRSFKSAILKRNEGQ